MRSAYLLATLPAGALIATSHTPTEAVARTVALGLVAVTAIRLSRVRATDAGEGCGL